MIFIPIIIIVIFIVHVIPTIVYLFLISLSIWFILESSLSFGNEPFIIDTRNEYEIEIDNQKRRKEIINTAKENLLFQLVEGNSNNIKQKLEQIELIEESLNSKQLL